MGFKDHNCSHGCQLIGIFMITLQVTWWELVTTGYLDSNKKGKGKATSLIEF